MKAEVTIMLKEGVLDPQGRAIATALTGLGFGAVADARQGKVVEITLAAGLSEDEARAQVRDMCERLLANPVIETYRIHLDPA